VKRADLDPGAGARSLLEFPEYRGMPLNARVAISPSLSATQITPPPFRLPILDTTELAMQSRRRREAWGGGRFEVALRRGIDDR
jgi:hypothetical protein